MLRDNLVGLIVPMQSCRTQVLGDEFSCLENPRPVGAESSLTGRCSSPFQTEPRHWAIDRVHSTAQFKVKHMMISNVLGEFTSITGVLERNENDITKSKIRASIDADTIKTR